MSAYGILGTVAGPVFSPWTENSGVNINPFAIVSGVACRLLSRLECFCIFPGPGAADLVEDEATDWLASAADADTW